MRVEAGVALQRLAARCSQATAAKALLSHAFAEYNGAGGKLTSSEDKIAVLNVSICKIPNIVSYSYDIIC